MTPTSNVTFSFKFRVRVSISASYYGANRAIYIAAGRKCPQAQVTKGQDRHWSARCSKQMLLALWYADVKGLALMQVPLVAIPPSSSAAVSKVSTPWPRESDLSPKELGECRQSHTLRFGKCF